MKLYIYLFIFGLGVGLEVALGDDHVDQLVGEIDIRGFQCAAENRADVGGRVGDVAGRSGLRGFHPLRVADLLETLTVREVHQADPSAFRGDDFTAAAGCFNRAVVADDDIGQGQRVGFKLQRTVSTHQLLTEIVDDSAFGIDVEVAGAGVQGIPAFSGFLNREEPAADNRHIQGIASGDDAALLKELVDILGVDANAEAAAAATRNQIAEFRPGVFEAGCAGVGDVVRGGLQVGVRRLDAADADVHG